MGGRRKLIEEISEGAMEAVWMELSKVREVVAEDIADLHLEYFAPKVLGGKWLAGKIGRSYDQVLAVQVGDQELTSFF